MSTNINWGQLVAQGRVKAHGVPWNDEERAALDAGMKPQDVRAGILTKEDLEAATEEGRLYHRMSDAELVEKAKELGVKDFVETDVTREWLLAEIDKAESKGAKKKSSPASDASASDEQGESGDEEESEEDEEAPDLDSMKKDELVEFAKSQGVEVTEDDTKATLKEKLAAKGIK